VFAAAASLAADAEAVSAGAVAAAVAGVETVTGAAAGSTFAVESTIAACAAAANVSDPTATASSVSPLRPAGGSPGEDSFGRSRTGLASVVGSLLTHS